MSIFNNIVLRTVMTAALVLTCSCGRLEVIESQLENIEDRIDSLESAVAAINANAISASALLKEGVAITGVIRNEAGYEIELSDGRVLDIVDGLKVKGNIPVIGIDKDGDWIISTDNGQTFQKMTKGYGPVPESGMTPTVKIDSEGFWEVSMDGGETWMKIRDEKGRPVSAKEGKEVAGVRTFFTKVEIDEQKNMLNLSLADGREIALSLERSFYFELTGYTEKEVIFLGETLSFNVVSKNVAELALIAPEGWKATYENDILSITSPSACAPGIYETLIITVSDLGETGTYSVILTLDPDSSLEGTVKEWMDFVGKREENVLLDFSYAGYRHGEEAPAEVETLGYAVYDVTDYGAIPDDDLSDREAFIKALTAALGKTPTIDASNCLSFPHKAQANAVIYFPEGEFILHTEEDDVNGKSQSILIQAGNIIIKGAGKDRTTLAMRSPMLPADENILYSSPDMIQLKHNSTFSSYEIAAGVTQDSPKGSFHVEVSSSASINEGDWVCLHVKNNSSEFVDAELAPYTADPSWDIAINGVEVIEYHKVKAIRDNVIIFMEPLHHEVTAGTGWEIKKYPHYENVGIEDLTFKGEAKENFDHHGSWNDDGGFKPVSMSRVTDSWIRRVGFVNISEACSIINSSNVSAYDITIEGVRGHAAVRSQASSRVLIARTLDNTSNGAGQFHAVGVSRQSIGTVLWRNIWGNDSCFESHATQPRATLIDCCSGGWHRGHQGGESQMAPHHLADLTIWNFTATETGETGNFAWWGSEAWWKFLPPVIVGFKADSQVIFSPDDTKTISSQNMTAQPESLYEAQLKQRLGHVPAWLNTMKQL